jgi:glycosyltransferase involved in cell wall biosynthesis
MSRTRPLSILFVHNFYQQAGGEDLAFADEAELFRERGHHVVTHQVHNDRVKGMNPISLAAATMWNSRAADRIRQLIRENAIDVCHFHNTFPLISPAAYHAANSEGVAVVQTLHNYRIICPGATLYRDGKVCETCIGKSIPWPGLLHACYRGSVKASLGVSSMLAFHRMLGTWSAKVQVYIALTEFSRHKFTQAGLPADRVVVKRNFLQTNPGAGTGNGGFALFVGRLVPEKGIETMLKAWETIGQKLPLRIAGSGPLASLVAESAARIPGVTALGRVSDEDLQQLMGDASVLIFPSEWYEGLPRTIIESYARGTPVIASRIGSLIDAVKPGETGFHFNAGDSDDLAQTVMRVTGQPALLQRLRLSTRKVFEATYTPEVNYRQLSSIYDEAITKLQRPFRGVRVAAAAR